LAPKSEGEGRFLGAAPVKKKVFSIRKEKFKCKNLEKQDQTKNSIHQIMLEKKIIIYPTL
jgi:hypothetical protein